LLPREEPLPGVFEGNLQTPQCRCWFECEPNVEGSDYVFSDTVPGSKHFGVWPLTEAAQACFGQDTWPDTHPVPQASVEFEVDDVAAAAQELEGRGHRLLHGARTEPWGQTVARLQSSDGVVVGVCFTPWMRES
jgi:hypothetical protein